MLLLEGHREIEKISKKNNQLLSRLKLQSSNQLKFILEEVEQR